MGIINFAQNSFRSDGEQLLVPYQKFNFTLVLDFNDRASSVFTRISSVTAPGYTVDGQLMNQYNRKRFVQTRLNYDPVTVAFYDTVDNDWQDIMTSYLRYYYNGGRGVDPRVGNDGSSTVTPNFESDMGFTPNQGRYFFPQIRIIQHGYRNEHRETVLINPAIVNIQGDTLSYSDSQPVMITVTFQPEYIETQPLSSGFDLPDYLTQS